ncbi:MAG: sulfur carrier protein ThiS [Deltaproteobacteria bacterium]|jgi:thiamine biosynthesis protein ThiS|nr:sulfur carrier protein ThiS [Deltaproteobacteria bacterium]
MVRVDGKEFFWREGMTVADLLKELGDPYPYAVVRISDRLISRSDFDKAIVPNDSEVLLIPLISGG